MEEKKTRKKILFKVSLVKYYFQFQLYHLLEKEKQENGMERILTAF